MSCKTCVTIGQITLPLRLFSHSSGEDQNEAPINPKFLNLGHSEKMPSTANFPLSMLFWKFATRGQCEYNLALQSL